MRVWHLAHGSEGYVIVSYRTPRWALIVERVYGWLDWATGERLSGARLGEWAWRLPLGRPRRDPESPDLLLNSLGSRLFDLFQWACSRSHANLSDEVWIPVTVDQARVIDPDFVAGYEAMWETA